MDPKTLDLLALLGTSMGGLLGLVAWRRARATAFASAGGDEASDAPVGPLRAVVGPVAAHLRPTSQAELDQLVTRLQRAGRRGRGAVDRYLEERIIALGLGLGGGFFLLVAVGGGFGFLLMCFAALAGIIGPDRVLESKGAARRDAVAAGLPGAVDLLVTCLDAGLSLEQAIARVAKDLSHSSPTLAEELGITASEFEAGVSLPDALRRLARRVGLDDLSAMCGVVAQAHALGAPIAHTLREYAISSRRQRMALLEERAGKLSTQLTIPLALCLLPAAMLIILGPAAVQLVRALK